MKNRITQFLMVLGLLAIIAIGFGASYGDIVTRYITCSTLTATGDATFKNWPATGGHILRNGGMSISQRQPISGGNLNIVNNFTANSYTIDGYYNYSTGTNTCDTMSWHSFSSYTGTDTPRDGYAQPTAFMQIKNGKSIGSSPDASALMFITQPIESQELIPFASQTVTLSAQVWCDSPINFAYGMQSASSGRTWVTSTTLVANTWTKVVASIPLESAINYGAEGNLVGGSCFISLLAGSSMSSATPGSWVATNTPGIETSKHFAYTKDTIFRVTNWKLEPGSVATPFVPRSYSEELARNTRYYEIIRAQEAFAYYGSGHIYSNTTNGVVEWVLNFSPKRAKPNIAMYGAFYASSGGNAREFSNLNASYKTLSSSGLNMTVSGTFLSPSVVGSGCVIYDGGAGTSYIVIESEL